ncbi:MAG: hypothetical protein SNJ72_00465 [Fimbriimonadales bacterium]
MQRLAWLGVWLVLVFGAYAQPYSDGVHLLDDLSARWQTAQLSDVLGNSRLQKVRSGGVERLGAQLHPTARPARAQFNLSLPAVNPGDRLVLMAWVGLSDDIPRDDPQNPHDGVRARVLLGDTVLAAREVLVEGWHKLSADLTAYAGQEIALVFEIEGRANTNYDWAYIAEARLVRLRERFARRVARELPPEGVLEVSGRPGDEFVLTAPDHPPLRALIPTQGILWLQYAFPGARSAQISELQPDSVARVYLLQPRLRLLSVATRRRVHQPGEVAELVATVQNVGAGTWLGNLLRVEAMSLQEAQVLGTPSTSTEFLPPGATREVVIPVRLGARPRLSVVLRSDAGNDTLLIDPIVVPSLPSGIPQGNLAQKVGEQVVLQNESLRVVLSPAWGAPTALRVFARQGGEWVLVATSAPVADAVVNVEGGPPKTVSLVPESITPNADGMRVIVQGTIGLTARGAVDLRLNGNRLEMTGRITANTDSHLHRFRFPDLRIGDGSFGSAKDEALFPGLEYLVGDERSSDTRHVAPPNHLRFSPDPLKVTVPVMAVRWRNFLVSMEWDPQAGWSGVLRAPNPLFASPNFLEQGANHRFALWAPAIPRWAEENTEVAREPFRLLKGTSVLLSASLVVRTEASDVVEAIEQYLQRVGMPFPPAPTRNDLASIPLTVQGLLNAYDASRRQWLHTNTGPTEYDPMVALGLWVLGHRLFPEDLRRQRALEQVREAVSARVPEQVGWELAFYVGRLPENLKLFSAEVTRLRQSQRPDGSWEWQPSSPRHNLLGKAGDTASGWSAHKAVPIGQYALLSLDPASRESLLRTARYLLNQRRPEGAQTWELTLHVPDLLAVPYAVQVLLDAHALTGNEAYLQGARRWALRGVPFVYTWSLADRPIMRGATIPAFGATWISQQPWFGVAVQWNGLVYARALYRLAQQDTTYDWKRLADTITLCAVQMQEWVCDRSARWEGFYPDAFNIPKGTEEYTWNLNPRLLAPCLAQRVGLTLEPKTLLVRDSNREYVACTAPGLQTLSMESGVIRAQIVPPAPDLPALYVWIAGFETPRSVRLNGTPLGAVEDMDSLIWQIPNPRSGWARTAGGLVVRVVQPSGAISLEVE